MPAQIIVVHNDHAVLDPLANALRGDGYEAIALDNPMEAWDALCDGCKADVLVTRIRFPIGNPHGLALARRARTNIRHIRVVFVAAPEMAPYTDGLGLFMATPIHPAAVVDAVNQMNAPAVS